LPVLKADKLPVPELNFGSAGMTEPGRDSQPNKTSSPVGVLVHCLVGF